MIDSTLELITQAASNSLFIFCFCNLIILMILMGSKPAGSSVGQESAKPVPVQITAWENAKQGRKSMHSFGGSRRLMEVKEVSHVHEEAVDDQEENSCSGSSSSSSGSSNHHVEEDDELRRRVEEFIEKVNRGWKAELMRTSHLV